MDFDYDAIKRKEESQGQHWASYSDLFMVLSVVFLLLYTVASFRNGTMAVSSQVQLRQAQEELEHKQKELTVFETVKDDYVNEMSEDEKEIYDTLVSQIDILESKAKEEKIALKQQAKAQEERERKLKRFKGMIKNVIDANLISSAKIRERDTIISEKEQKLVELSANIQEKENLLSANEREIERAKTELEKQIKEVRYAYRSRARAKEKMAQEIEALKTASEQKISKLQSENTEVRTALSTAKSELTQREQEAEKLIQSMAELEEKYQTQMFEAKKQHEQQIAQAEKQFQDSLQNERLSAEQKLEKERLHRLKLEKANLQYNEKISELDDKLANTQGKIAQIRESYEASMSDLQKANRELKVNLDETRQKIAETKANHEATLMAERDRFQKELQQTNLSAKAKLQKEVEFRKQMEAKTEAYNQRLASLNDEMRGLSDQNKQLSKNLKATMEIANARRRLAKKIADNLRRAGISADVNPETGDVVINFGDEYFDTGKDQLKPGMQSIVKHFMPVYAKSLFEDPQMAKKISSVEIVGFASPTYQNRMVDPTSLSVNDRKAVDYNLDLSYRRAKSIFSYVFDTRINVFEYQKELLPLVKVAGRGYHSLSELMKSRNIASESLDTYCKANDCKKLQNVLIKFHFSEK